MSSKLIKYFKSKSSFEVLFESYFKSLETPSCFPLSILFLGRNQKKEEEKIGSPVAHFSQPI
jgi:hypothetical protein